MKALVTGATGFIGSEITAALIARGDEPTVLARQPESVAKFAWKNDVILRMGSLESTAELEEACRGQDVIIHCAGYAHDSGREDARHDAINHLGTCNLLKAAVSVRVPRFVYISTSKVKSAHPSPYSMSKRLAEDAVIKAHLRGDIQAVSVRPVGVYGKSMKGNLAAWIRRVQTGSVPPLPNVKTRIALIGVRDLAQAVLLTLSNDKVWGKCWTVADGNAYGIKDIERAIRLCCGKSAARLSTPKVCYYGAALLGQLKENISGNAAFNLKGYRTLFNDEFENGEPFRQLSGFIPQDNLYKALPEIVEHMKL